MWKLKNGPELAWIGEILKLEFVFRFIAITKAGLPYTTACSPDKIIFAGAVTYPLTVHREKSFYSISNIINNWHLIISIFI